VQRIASDAEAAWVRDRLVAVDTPGRRLQTEGGGEISYDALLLAVGAGQASPYEHAKVFTDRDGGDTFRGILHDLALGEVSSVAFVLSNWPVWPLPLYELALMTAERASKISRPVQLTFITPEGRPLKAFGQAAGDVITRLFVQAGIELHTGVLAQVPRAQLVTFGETQLEAQRIVTLPKVTGPALRGIAAGPGWFVPIDEHCVVHDSDGRVFAAGDATDFVVKHGGIGAQQADTAAAGIAHLAGIGERPPALAPVIRSTLLTGDRPLYLCARVVNGLGWRSEVYEEPPWSSGPTLPASTPLPARAADCCRRAVRATHASSRSRHPRSACPSTSRRSVAPQFEQSVWSSASCSPVSSAVGAVIGTP